jgi:hypothetical protein
VVSSNGAFFLRRCCRSHIAAAQSTQVCFSGDGNYGAVVSPENLEQLFQAAAVEVGAAYSCINDREYQFIPRGAAAALCLCLFWASHVNDFLPVCFMLTVASSGSQGCCRPPAPEPAQRPSYLAKAAVSR